MSGTFTTSAVSAPGAVTFASVLRLLAAMVGAVLHESTVVSASGTTLVDTIELGGLADDTLNGKRVYIYEGTGIGQERRITDHTGSSGTLTVPTWATNPTSSSKYLVLKEGWTIGMLRSAWLQAMRRRREYYMLPLIDESIELVVTVGVPTYEYGIPTGFATIQDIVREDTDGGADFNTVIPPDCWFISTQSSPKIVFEKAANDQLGYIVDGLALRVVGQKYESEPATDSSTFDIPTGALLLLAASIACQARRTGDTQNTGGYGQLANTYFQEWLNARGDDEKQVWPRSRWVKF